MQSRPITEPGLITELQPISVLSPTIAPNFFNPVGMSPSGVINRDFGVIEFDVRENHARAKVRLIAQDGVAHVIEMRHLCFIEQNAILELARVAHYDAIASDDVLAHVATAANLAVFADPRRALQHRALLNDRSSPNEHAIADERFTY